MTGEIESQPLEIPKSREETDNTEGQKLNDATIEPLALIEQTGDFRQAEILQEAFTGIVENAEEMTAPEIQLVEGMLIPASSSGEAVPPVTLPGQRTPMGDGQQPPPDQIMMQPVTEGGHENEGGESGILLEASVLPFMPESQESEEGSPVQPASVLEAGALIMEEGTGPDMFEGSLVEGEAVLLDEAVAETEEVWIPPEMYVYSAQDGTKTVVDVDGNPVNCPPSLKVWLDGKGEQSYEASYPGGERWVLATYSAPLTGMFVYLAQDGTKTVVDVDGNPVNCPPSLKMWLTNLGEQYYEASYPGGQGTPLEYYKPPSATPASGSN